MGKRKLGEFGIDCGVFKVLILGNVQWQYSDRKQTFNMLLVNASS
jgi:hypothetical protein